ncbi:MAG: glycosyltransferase [Thermoplasmataceae archaeon]
MELDYKMPTHIRLDDPKAIDRVVVNTCHPPAAVYGYSINLLKVLSERAVLANFLIDPKKWKLPHQGLDFRGSFPTPSLNFLFNGAYQNSLKNLFLKVESNKAVIHFADQIIPTRMFAKFNLTTTVHDNPDLVYNSNLYFDNTFSGNLKRKYFKKRFDEYLQLDEIVAVSNFVKEGVLRYGFRGNIAIIPPPVPQHFYEMKLDKKEIRRKLGLPVAAKLVLSVSTDVPRKNLLKVKQAMDQLYPEFQLVRVGIPVGNSITMNNLTNEEMNLLYNSCDALLHPTLAEGAPSVILEAFEVGLPVIASNIPPVREMSNNSAILVDPSSSSAISHGVMKAFESREELITKGKRQANLYTFENFKRKLLDYYERFA